MNKRILLVEDEPDLTVIVADTLRSSGYEVVTACDGKDGLTKFISGGVDIVVADVMMPRMDGFSMAKAVRRLSKTVPILFLTAKSEIDDVERGFDIGANDYLRKPFELRELIIRIKALLGRSDNRPAEYNIGAYRFIVATQTLIFGNTETELSQFEAGLLEILAANMGSTVDAAEIMRRLWRSEEINNRNSLHGYIHKLRHVLRHDRSVGIINRRGFGYMLVVKDRF